MPCVGSDVENSHLNDWCLQQHPGVLSSIHIDLGYSAIVNHVSRVNWLVVWLFVVERGRQWCCIGGL